MTFVCLLVLLVVLLAASIFYDGDVVGDICLFLAAITFFAGILAGSALMEEARCKRSFAGYNPEYSYGSGCTVRTERGRVPASRLIVQEKEISR